MKLRAFEEGDQPELMAWFPDPSSCRMWGGPEFRHPFTAETFREDAQLDGRRSWTLVAADGTPLGFGQYYLRLERCHLSRLAVAPASRGRGIGSTLILELCHRGGAQLGVSSYSLFVFESNEPALRLYRRMGFAVATYPEPAPAPGCVYMVATEILPGGSTLPPKG